MTELRELLDSIDRYVIDGVPTGSFLEAVLSNDLRESCSRADETSRINLFDLVYYLYNEVPRGCWGSVGRYHEWLAMDASERRRLVALSSFGRKRGLVYPSTTENET